MSSSGGATAYSWTEVVEDLVDSGEIDQAIAFLESTINNLEKEIGENQELVNDGYGENSCSSRGDQLSTALQDLSKLYSTKGLSLRADEAMSRALQLKNRRLPVAKGSISDGVSEACVSENEATTSGGIADDDWEAVADRAPQELFSPQSLPGLSKLSLEDPKEAQSIKRRGRGTFSYKKQGLHSDNQSDEPLSDDSDNNSHNEALEKPNLKYGTCHVLVLADFHPSTRTTDLEKVLEKFKDRFVIRWVKDTMALAVFRTPSIALEARNSIQCPFKVHILDESDGLLNSIPPKDLEPPRQRPQTSARTAQRLIAQGMGIKLPSTFGSTELRKQEEARRNRIVSRQTMKNDAWGDDDNDAK